MEKETLVHVLLFPHRFITCRVLKWPFSNRQIFTTYQRCWLWGCFRRAVHYDLVPTNFENGRTRISNKHHPYIWVIEGVWYNPRYLPSLVNMGLYPGSYPVSSFIPAPGLITSRWSRTTASPSLFRCPGKGKYSSREEKGEERSIRVSLK